MAHLVEHLGQSWSKRSGPYFCTKNVTKMS